MTGPLVLIGALVVALAVGVMYVRRNGRFRDRGDSAAAGTTVVGPGTLDPAPLDPARFGATFGQRATLLQFSSAFCSPCRATRSILGEVARITPGVAHVEVDAEQHLELVRELKILRTPTVLVLDADGVERRRASGLPTRDHVLSALAAAI